MRFRTKIDISLSELQINHHAKIMLLGSCFAENIGQHLLCNKFEVNVNPFGILYNPASIVVALKRMITTTPISESELWEDNGLFGSFLHHGSFSRVTKEEALSVMNKSLKKAAEDLKNIDTLIITCGTAYIYKLKESDTVVANCHKFPASMFRRERMPVESIIQIWSDLITQLKKINPKLNILFTVSPIRHWKDGAHDNQLSKASLLLAVDALQSQFDNLYYFPSYEIVMDELRDYRFYAEDMIHPNEVCTNYIWERFTETFFDCETSEIIKQWKKFYQTLNHRPFNTQTEEYKQFLRQTLLKLEMFQKKYLYLNCEKEISTLKKQL